MNTKLALFLLAHCCTCMVNAIYHGRNLTAVLKVKGSKWGKWGDQEFCPPGMYASAFTLKAEKPCEHWHVDCKKGDETALNGVKLHCTGGGKPETTITSGVGVFGHWLRKQSCGSSVHGPYYFSSFRLDLEPFQGHYTDDSAANNLSFWCRDKKGFQHWRVGNSPAYWGNEKIQSAECPKGSYICGLMTRIEPNQGTPYWDDTAFNDVHFYCCDDNL